MNNLQTYFDDIIDNGEKFNCLFVEDKQNKILNPLSSDAMFNLSVEPDTNSDKYIVLLNYIHGGTVFKYTYREKFDSHILAQSKIDKFLDIIRNAKDRFYS